MKKLYLMFSVLSTLLLINGSITCEDPSLNLVVGNCRRPGGLKESYARLVEQDRADFTHTQSFKGRVISVDICPLQPHLIRYPHLTMDFANATPQDILSKLNTHPSVVFFEWFPSCITESPGQNITPLLLPALKNAFEILSHGGKLIIDHNPYTLSLPDSSNEAFKTLVGEKVQAKKELVLKAVTLGVRLQEIGILSHFLQIADPFTLHICRQEKNELRNYLIFRIKESSKPFDDTKCLFIKGKCQTISELITVFSSALGMEMNELMSRISNGILYSAKGIHEEEQGYSDLFEQQYYMKTRAPLIVAALQDIGFVVKDNAIQYHKINPYNRRKLAWLISARKPAAVLVPTALGDRKAKTSGGM